MALPARRSGPARCWRSRSWWRCRSWPRRSSSGRRCRTGPTSRLVLIDRRLHVCAGLGLLPPVRGGRTSSAGSGRAGARRTTSSHSSSRHVGDHPVAQDAGVVDQHVRGRRSARGRVDQPLGALAVGDVVGVGDRLAAQRRGSRRPPAGPGAASGPVPSRRAAEVVHDDLGALARRTAGRAHARCRAPLR